MFGFVQMCPYQTFQSDCSQISSDLQITTSTKMLITYSFLHEINPNQSQIKVYSLNYQSIQIIHDFQAVHGRIRPGTTTKTEKLIKITT